MPEEAPSSHKKYTVILFQQYLRQFVLNFGKDLKYFTFKTVSAPPIAGGLKLPSFDKEINRTKLTRLNIMRRILGIPNFRVRWNNEDGDMYFTYGSLIVGRKPYCTYIETGLALYNYDPFIAKHPIARLIVMFLATRPDCHKLIFVSEASRKSFYATVWYPGFVRRILEKKSQVIYPVPIANRPSKIKKYNGTLKLVFPGMFYIKGGLELAHAYERLRQKHDNVSLTIITALHAVWSKDQEYMRSLPGLTLLDAKLNEQEMIDIYQSHDIFILPTMRDGFGLVLIEALAYAMPMIITDQYATTEMGHKDYNAFVFPNHVMQDYDPKTYRLLGKYYHPKYFYKDLFQFQKDGKTKPLEDFIVASVEKFLENPDLVETYSKNSRALYDTTFLPEKLREQIDAVFLAAVEGKN